MSNSSGLLASYRAVLRDALTAVKPLTVMSTDAAELREMETELAHANDVIQNQHERIAGLERDLADIGAKDTAPEASASPQSEVTLEWLRSQLDIAERIIKKIDRHLRVASASFSDDPELCVASLNAMTGFVELYNLRSNQAVAS